MTFKRKLGFGATVAMVILNIVGGVYASLTGEPIHAFAHGAVAVGFGLWARYLCVAPVRHVSAPAKVQMLEEDLTDLQRQLIETQERLDFADQLLKQRPKAD